MASENFALDLDLFDVQKSGYAPQEEPKRKIQKPKLLQPKPISIAEIKSDARESRKMAARACVYALIALLFVGSLIFCRVELTNLQLELNEAQSALKIAEAENISLQMRYNSMMAVDKIEEYAQSKLGMVKRESYQISYFDISDNSGAQLTQ